MFSRLFQMCLLYYEGSAETNTVPIFQASQDNSVGLQVKGRQDQRAGDQPECVMWPRPQSIPHSLQGQGEPPTPGPVPEASDSRGGAVISHKVCIFTIIYSPRRQGASVIFIHLCWEERIKVPCHRKESV